jgi:hypothetical protein
MVSALKLKYKYKYKFRPATILFPYTLHEGLPQETSDFFSYHLAYYNTHKDKGVQYKFSSELTSTSLSRIKTRLSQVRLQERKLSEMLGYVTLREVQYVLLFQTGHMFGLCCSNLTPEIDISTSPLPRFKDQSTP